MPHNSFVIAQYFDPRNPMPFIRGLHPKRTPRNYRYWKVDVKNKKDRGYRFMKLDFNWGFGRDFKNRIGVVYRAPKGEAWNRGGSKFNERKFF